MTILSPKYCLAIVVLIFTIQASAQKISIKKESNAKVFCSYHKQIIENKAVYEIQIAYKNDQAIYTQEVDTITLHSQVEVNDFNSNLQKVIASLSDEKSNPSIEKANYKIFKLEKGMLGNFVGISNLKGSIETVFSKYQTLDLLEWTKSIEFGKE